MKDIPDTRNVRMGATGQLDMPLVFTGARLKPDGGFDFTAAPDLARQPLFAFGDKVKPKEAMLNYGWAMSQVGAMVLRLDQITTGMAHLVQIASEEPALHKEHQIQIIPSMGQPLDSMYDHNSLNGRLLEKTAALIGSGRFKNARAQRISHTSSRTSPLDVGTGSMNLMEVLHGPLMAAGGEMMRQLGNQGFHYLPGPLDSDVQQAVEDGNYTVNEGQIKIDTGKKHISLPLIPLSNRFSASLVALGKNNELLDPIMLKGREQEGKKLKGIHYMLGVKDESGQTSEPGLLISADGKVLPHELMMDVLRLDVHRKPGFNSRPSGMNDLLFEGRRFAPEREHTSTRSIAFDGMIRVFNDIIDYGFDPIALSLTHGDQPTPIFRTLYTQTHRDSTLSDALLYQALASQASHPLVMIEGEPVPNEAPAKTIRGNEGRAVRHRLPISHEMNAMRAIADFLGWKKAEVRTPGRSFNIHKDYLLYESELPAPDMSDAPKVAGLLALSLISAEQMLITHLIPAASKDRSGMEATALKNIIEAVSGQDPELVFNEMVKRADAIAPQKLGRQHPKSTKLLQYVRETLHLDKLAVFTADELATHQPLTRETFQSVPDGIKKGVVSLAHINDVFQHTPGISTAHAGSKGIGAVTDAFIAALAPELKEQSHTRIYHSLKKAQSAFKKHVKNVNPLKVHITEAQSLEKHYAQAVTQSRADWERE